MGDDALAGFVERAARLAGLAGTTRPHGVSRIHTGALAGRTVAVATNGSYYWVEAELVLPGLPAQSGIEWAPHGLYTRAKLGDTVQARSGDDDFDSMYLVVGPDAEALVALISPKTIAAFVKFASIQASLMTFDVATMQPRLHLDCRPLVPDPREVRQWLVEGAGAAHAAKTIGDAVELAAEIERAQGC